MLGDGFVFVVILFLALLGIYKQRKSTLTHNFIECIINIMKINSVKLKFI